MIIDRLFKRGTIQSPSIPLSEAYDLLTAGEKSHTGISVTQEKVLGNAGYWKGVNLISRGIAKTPIMVQKRIDESYYYDRMHPAWYLLRKLPTGVNYEVPCTPFIFKQTLQANCLDFGNGFAYIMRNGMQQPVGLIWLDPNAVIPLKENGSLMYLVTLESGELRKIPPMDMIHIKGLSYDGITGYRVIDVMKNMLGLNLAYEMNQSVFFKNQMRPGWILEVPWKFRDEAAVANFRKKMGRVHQGLAKSHIPMILENGAKASPLNISHEDAQFMQSREFDLRMLANLFFLPSSKLNDIAKTAYNSLEQENQSVLDDAYDPWFIVWEEEFEYKLLSEKEKETDSHRIRFNRRDIVRIPFKDRVEGTNKAVLSGWLSKDEAREEEGLNPIPKGKGKVFYIPANVIPDNEETEADNDMEIEDDRIEKAKEIARQAIHSIAAKLVNRRIAKAARMKAVNPNSFMTWLLDDLVDLNRDAFVDLLNPFVSQLKLLNGSSTDSNVERLVDDYLLDIRSELNQLAGMVSKTELITSVELAVTKRCDTVCEFADRLIKKG